MFVQVHILYNSAVHDRVTVKLYFKLTIQILSFFHTNKSNDCFGLILSTDEIEPSFTGPVRFCHGISLENATGLYSSGSSGVIILRYHVLDGEKMFLQLRFFNRPKQGYCNYTLYDIRENHFTLNS